MRGEKKEMKRKKEDLSGEKGVANVTNNKTFLAI